MRNQKLDPVGRKKMLLHVRYGIRGLNNQGISLQIIWGYRAKIDYQHFEFISDIMCIVRIRILAMHDITGPEHWIHI